MAHPHASPRNDGKAQGDQEAVRELQASKSKAVVNGYHADLCQPWDVDHSHAATQMQELLSVGDRPCLQNVLSIVQVIPQICMPQWTVGHYSKHGSDEQHEQC